MNKMMRNTLIKVLLVLLLSVTATSAVFLGGGAAVLSQLGLYDNSYEDYTLQILEDDAYRKGVEFRNSYIVSPGKTIELKGVEEDEICDFKVVQGKKVLYDSYDENEEYLSVATYSEAFYPDNEGNSANIIDITAYLKSSGSTMEQLAQWTWGHKMLMIVLGAVLLVISILLYVLLMIGAGRREEDDEIHVRKIDRMPIDLYLFLAGTPIGCMIALGASLAGDNLMTGIIASYLMGILCVLLFIAFSMTFAIQGKKGMLIRNSIIGRIIFCLLRLLRGAGKSIPFVWKYVVVAALISLFSMALVASCCYDGAITAFILLEGLLFVAGVWYFALMCNRLKNGAKEISEGNISYAINQKYMLPALKEHADVLNDINSGINKAVNERMRSERFKTELITNVSHDIKTPLTSIINYTDLLKKEYLGNEKAKEYVETIDKHAQKLKKLTLDIVDASKASTGNVKVELSRCSLAMMLEQVVGEYQEKMEARGLKPVFSIPDEDVVIMADGRHMGRVFDNVLSNICKYAQDGTRVYMDVRPEGDTAVMSFKNISKDELNISADELMERFIRGDSSRNTEGSGLGLSIAKSLTALQGGSFDISIDGDLFKVEIRMPMA